MSATPTITTEADATTGASVRSLTSHLSYAYDNAQILQWLLFLRVVVATFVLGTIFILDLPEVRGAFYLIIVVHVLTALLSALLIQVFGRENWFLHLQVYWDILFVTALIFIAGGYYSFFSFLYVISVINAAVLLERNETIVAATVCILALTLILLLQWYGVVGVPNVSQWEPVRDFADVLSKLVFSIFAVFAAAYLSVFLSERAREVSSELRKKQDDLKELKARFEHMIRSIPIGLLALDQNQEVVYANGAVEKILGIPPGHLVGLSLGEAIPQIAVKSVAELARPIEINMEREGEPVYVEISHSNLVAEDGHMLGSLLILVDRSEVKSMEDAVRRSDRLAAVGQLAAAIAHEIRNPMASISGSIQLLTRELELDSVNQHLMDIVIRESDRVNALVSDFLAFARPKPENKSIVDAQGVMDDMLRVLENEPGVQDRVTIHKMLEKRLYVMADPRNLRQLLWNLAINAVQAMPEGGDLTFQGRVRDVPFDSGNRKVVELSVMDTGSGMDTETLKSIFDPFFTTKENGTGLGLSTCHNIVEMYRGRILVESRMGRGSKFTVQLPAAERAGEVS
ncbi:MAG: PAS domain-containing protein [Deltaproteobacteria bacterium]|nr:PAS domain-containing protein [Deltaproteobacteria bacterium]MCB9478991.1 PAS domain-containing protein [Deltaproteobacteria bacterium]MCB9487801.1 PAS domain-containing protein [Deltaproteobacteria bacterium]